MAALLCAAVVVGYLPALHGGFIWDDTVLLSENPLVKADDGLKRFWLTTEAPDYWPLMSTTFWLEWRLWGKDPTGYHATNMALHAIEALLLWAILARLRIGGAWLAALLFAVHPVNVESVAWIAQRKNLVALLFCLVSTFAFLKADDPPPERGLLRPGAGRWYWLSLAAFVLAMLGKGSAAVLPPVLLLLAWWRRRRIGIGDVVRVTPFAAIAAGLVSVNIWFQTHGSAIQIRAAGPVERLLGAAGVVWFYLGKALLPVDLAFIYPQWTIDPGRLAWWLPLAAAVLVTLLLLRYRDGWARPFLMAWAFFCVSLLPVMGFTDVYFMTYSLVADHYQHIALIGVVALAAAGWAAWQRRLAPARRPLAVFAAAAVVVALVLLTGKQSALYADADTIYRDTLRKNPGCWLAHYNLGVNLSVAGQREESVSHLQQALRFKPDFAEAHNNMAIALAADGRLGEALAHAEQAVRSKPHLPHAKVTLGMVLAKVGRPAEALRVLEQALAMDDGSVEVRYNLGLALTALGRHREALAQLAEAVRLDPGSADAHNAYGTAWMAVGRHPEAIAELQQALRLKPDDGEAHGNLAQVLMRSGRPQEALAEYERALQLQPSLPEAHYNLGLLLAMAGRPQAAVGHFEQAVRLRPGYAEAHNNLAVFLTREGRIAEAVEQLEQAVRARPDFYEARVNLAETCARSGRFAEAASHAEAALPLAPAAARPGLERKARMWRARGGAAGA